MKIRKFNLFLKESAISATDSNMEILNRTKEINEDEFLEILHNNCKNFSFSNDLLWRSRTKKYDLELFNPAPRNASVLAFKDFFDEIELNTEEYPVVRKNSLIGGTDKEICRRLVGEDIYLVIPFDKSEIVFCPIVDLYGLRDRADGRNSDKIGGKRVDKSNFIKVTYDSNFKIPLSELNKLTNANTKVGCEFFTSSPCLLLHESKIDWLKEMLKYPEIIKESNEDKNLVINDVEFSITIQELNYALFEITDVFPKLDTLIESSKNSTLIEWDPDVFVIKLDDYDHSETQDNYRDNYRSILYIEPKIFDCIEYLQDKMNYYGLDVLYSDFSYNSECEYEIVIGKKGHKITLKK